MTSAPPGPRSLMDRLDRLEARLAELEPIISTPAQRPVPAGMPSETGQFWALEELKARVADAGAVLFTGTVRLPAGQRFDWQQGLDVDALLDADWDLSADVLAALGHPVRLILLREILRGTQTVTGLGSVEGLGTSGQVYHHLRQLVAVGWLRSAGRGRYEVPAARVVPLLVVVAAAQR